MSIWHDPVATITTIVDDHADAYRVRLAIYEDNAPEGMRLVGEVWMYETSKCHLHSAIDRMRVFASDMGVSVVAEPSGA